MNKVKIGTIIKHTPYGKGEVINVDFTGLMFEVKFEYLNFNPILSKSMIELLIKITPSEIRKYYNNLIIPQ